MWRQILMEEIEVNKDMVQSGVKEFERLFPYGCDCSNIIEEVNIDDCENIVASVFVAMKKHEKHFDDKNLGFGITIEMIKNGVNEFYKKFTDFCDFSDYDERFYDNEIDAHDFQRFDVDLYISDHEGFVTSIFLAMERTRISMIC